MRVQFLRQDAERNASAHYTAALDNQRFQVVPPISLVNGLIFAAGEILVRSKAEAVARAGMRHDGGIVGPAAPTVQTKTLGAESTAPPAGYRAGRRVSLQSTFLAHNGSIRMNIRYASRIDGAKTAYGVVDAACVLIVPGWVSHLELWEDAAPALSFAVRLAERHTLVRYDRHGCGLSHSLVRSSC
jgi:hypothetical protein